MYGLKLMFTHHSLPNSAIPGRAYFAVLWPAIGVVVYEACLIRVRGYDKHGFIHWQALTRNWTYKHPTLTLEQIIRSCQRWRKAAANMTKVVTAVSWPRQLSVTYLICYGLQLHPCWLSPTFSSNPVFSLRESKRGGNSIVMGIQEPRVVKSCG